MGDIDEYPIAVHVDNVGYIFLLERTLVSQRKNHIDMPHHFIPDCIEEGILIEYV